MDSQKAFLVIGITLLVVVLINLGIYTVINRRKKSVGEMELFRRAMKKAQNPWQEEQANLKALSDQVNKLQESKNDKKTHDK